MYNAGKKSHNRRKPQLPGQRTCGPETGSELATCDLHRTDNDFQLCEWAPTVWLFCRREGTFSHLEDTTGPSVINPPPLHRPVHLSQALTAASRQSLEASGGPPVVCRSATPSVGRPTTYHGPCSSHSELAIPVSAFLQQTHILRDNGLWPFSGCLIQIHK